MISVYGAGVSERGKIEVKVEKLTRRAKKIEVKCSADVDVMNLIIIADGKVVANESGRKGVDSFARLAALAVESAKANIPKNKRKPSRDKGNFFDEVFDLEFEEKSLANSDADIEEVELTCYKEEAKKKIDEDIERAIEERPETVELKAKLREEEILKAYLPPQVTPKPKQTKPKKIKTEAEIQAEKLYKEMLKANPKFAKLKAEMAAITKQTKAEAMAKIADA